MTQTSIAKSPVKRRKEARPGEILEAALIEFSQNGFARTKLETIAKRAGVSKGTIYHYYKDKQALFHALIEEHLNAPLRSAQQTFPFSAQPPKEMIRLAIKEAYERAKGSPTMGLIRILLTEPDSLASFEVNPLEPLLSTISEYLPSMFGSLGLGQSPSNKNQIGLLFPFLSATILYDTLHKVANFDMDQFIKDYVDLLIYRLDREAD